MPGTLVQGLLTLGRSREATRPDSGSGTNAVGLVRRVGRALTDVMAWRSRPLDEHDFPDVLLDATSCKARISHRVVSRPSSSPPAGVGYWATRSATARPGVLPSAGATFWTEFLRGLSDRGLGGVRLVTAGGPTAGQ